MPNSKIKPAVVKAQSVAAKTKPAVAKKIPAAAKTATAKGKTLRPNPKQGINWKRKLGQFRKVAAKKAGVKKRRLSDDLEIIGPAVVPGNTEYDYYFDTSGLPEYPTSVEWSVDSDNASIDGDNDKARVSVIFANNVDSITLSLAISTDDDTYNYSMTISLVQVGIGDTTFSNPGTPPPYTTFAYADFLAIPPASPTVEQWITEAPRGYNGGDWQQFTYNGTSGPTEPAFAVGSASSDTGGAAFLVTTEVTLTAPDDNPDALTSINIGYIQLSGLSSSFTAYSNGYGRYPRWPSGSGVDWLHSPFGPSDAESWPWYDGFETGFPYHGIPWWPGTLSFPGDSPSTLFPEYYDPTDGDYSTLTSATVAIDFTIIIAVQTGDSSLDSDQLYFGQAYASWIPVFIWPVIYGASIVLMPSDWSISSEPSRIDVNAVPSIINASNYPADLPDHPYPYAFSHCIE